VAICGYRCIWFGTIERTGDFRKLAFEYREHE
jgi:hypothetical protein